MNYKIFVTKIILKSLKNFIFHFFMNQSLGLSGIILLLHKDTLLCRMFNAM